MPEQACDQKCLHSASTIVDTVTDPVLVHLGRPTYDGIVNRESPRLRVLCVGRHEYLAEHLCRFFTGMGLETQGAVGISEALEIARATVPDVVLCDYDLLSTMPIEAWERDALFSRTAVIGVSLTRRPHEMHLLDVNGIAGFLYLPTLDFAATRRILSAAAVSARSHYSSTERMSLARADQSALPA